MTAIAAGGSHAIALEAVNSAGQALYAWGDNAEGELGQGSTTDASRPKLVPGVTAAVAIAAGTSDSYVLGATGSVLAMGDASAGELPGLAASVSSPTTLTLPAGTDPVSLAASGEDLYVEADQNGAFGLLSYGADAEGQLGTPSAPASGVTSLGLSPALFSASASHLAVVLSGGEVAGLGEGTEGQLGQGTTASSQSLVGASGLVAFVPLAASGALSESTTDYTYDADGLRVLSETAASATPATWFGIGDDPQLLCEGATDFLYGPDGEVDEQELTDQDATPTYLIHDQAGSTRLLTDLDGNVVGTASYDPYGNPTAKWGETTPIGYSGGDTDPTGLVYLLHRYYDPQTGEFLSLDPLVAETMEPYAYGGDDPENYGDPSGEGKVPNPPFTIPPKPTNIFGDETEVPSTCFAHPNKCDSQPNNGNTDTDLFEDWVVRIDRQQDFDQWDPLTQNLMHDPHQASVLSEVNQALANGGPYQGRDNYSDPSTPSAFLHDMSGYFHNVYDADAFPGSYDDHWWLIPDKGKDCHSSGTAYFQVTNTTDLNSLLHPEVLTHGAIRSVSGARPWFASFTLDPWSFLPQNQRFQWAEHVNT